MFVSPMKQKERAGVMRIVSDVMKADSVITFGDMDILGRLKEKYRITNEDEIVGDSMTLSEAVCSLKCLSPKTIHDIADDLCSFLLPNALNSDKEYVLFAVVACLLGEFPDNAEIFSTVLPNGIFVDKSQILYVEGEYCEKANDGIIKFYREILTEHYCPLKNGQG